MSERLSYKQRKAISLLVVGEQNEEEVAEYLGISKSTLRGWMKQEKFASLLEHRIQALENADSKYRTKMSKHVVNAVYEEIAKRIAEGQTLQRLSFMKLMSAVKMFSNETRIDSGEATSRSEVQHSLLEEISNRYKARESGKVLTLVKDEKEKVSNG